MEKKYKTEKDSKTGLLRIIALKDFSDVKKGDKGGLIDNEENLSHEGGCWVYDNAKVYGNAVIFGSASVYGNARVGGRTMAWLWANIGGNVKLWSPKTCYISNFIENNKDYIILAIKREFRIISFSNIDRDLVKEDYLKNVKTIRRLYGEEI